MSGRRIAILVVLVLALGCVVVAGGVLAYRLLVPTAEAAVEPTVLIDSPRHGEEVTVGQPVQIVATGRDPTKIDRMELWVDGQFVVSQSSALAEGTSPFPLTAMWTPETVGNHTMVVRAYNMEDATGQASVSVNAVEAPEVQIPEGCEGVDLIDHVVQTGETLEGIAAGYEVTVEQILACNPGLDPTAMPVPGETLRIPGLVNPDEEGAPPDWEAPEDAEEAPDVPEDAEELPGEEPPPAEEEPPPGEEAPPEVEEAPEDGGVPEPEEPPVILGFEALEFEVDQPYDQVYCMVQLAEADMEQVPETGSFAPVGGNYWDIAAELAGANSRQVAVTGDTVHLEVECFGWIGLDGWSLGHFERDHPEADWTGEDISVQAIADDGRWFRVVYRICPSFPCEPRPVPEAPAGLSFVEWCPCSGTIGCPPCPEFPLLVWSWLGDPATIDGFRVYQNGAMLYEQIPTVPGVMLTQEEGYPSCGLTYDYQVSAYEGFPGVGPESDPSNTVTRTGPDCPRTVAVTFETLHTGCIHTDPCSDPTCAACYMPSWIGGFGANGDYITRLMPLGAPDIQSYSVYPVGDLFFGDDTVTVELAEGDDLTIELQIWDWDPPWPGGTYTPLLLGDKVIPSADVATGDYFMVAASPTPGVGFGVVMLHVEVTP